MKYKRQIAVISDTHTGSDVALWPEGFMFNQRHIPAGDKQGVFNKYWDEFTDRAGCCDTVFHLADACEGLAKKEGGTGLMISNLNAQIQAHLELIRPLCKKKKVLVWGGSRYHESFDYEIHNAIADDVQGRYMGVVSNLNVSGKKFHVKHAGMGGMQYRGAGLDKTNMNALMAAGAGKVDMHDLTIEGHFHYYQRLDTANGAVLRVPCWKAWEPSRFFAKPYHRMQPDIGGCIVRIDTYDKIDIEPIIFPLPHIADEWVAA